MCEACGKARDAEHSWEGDKCKRCGRCRWCGREPDAEDHPCLELRQRGLSNDDVEAVLNHPRTAQLLSMPITKRETIRSDYEQVFPLEKSIKLPDGEDYEWSFQYVTKNLPIYSSGSYMFYRIGPALFMGSTCNHR